MVYKPWFTNPNPFGGGISGGNGSHGPDDYCNNMDISNFYINSNPKKSLGPEGCLQMFHGCFQRWKCYS